MMILDNQSKSQSLVKLPVSQLSIIVLGLEQGIGYELNFNYGSDWEKSMSKAT